MFQPSLKGRAIFFTDQDRRKYLEILSQQAQFYKVDILAYCLMREHIHLVARPRRGGNLAKAIGRTNFSYARYLNRRRKQGGKLWRNRFQSCALDDRAVLTAAQYVECQPVYARLVRKAEKYPWSSASAHLKGVDKYGILALQVWPSRQLSREWSKILAQSLDKNIQAKLASYTQTGRPFGSRPFIQRLERKLGRRLHPLPVGRPLKEP